MSWNRIKTILIILFLFTDIFLASSILTAEKKKAELSPAVLDATVQILKDKNIILDKSVIPKKNGSAHILQADNAITDYASFAELILGEACFKKDGYTYVSDKGEISFSGDSFAFNAVTTGKSSGMLTQKNAQKTAFSFLKGLGFNMSTAKAVSLLKKDGIWRIKIRDFAEKRPVFSSEINISVSDSGVISLSGSWFNQKETREQDSNLKSITGILIDFAEKYADGSLYKITALELGYSVFDNENYHKSASLIPVGKIIVDKNTEYFIDARTNEQ